uniref:Hydantoinase B/oxoprolinase n=1 Tax=Candidatus Kentrum sp. LFY TaxID=2126342 RepID=A0A450UNJ1_9GAMM|nr:MAG: Hydantoinase B/oxoprolinase [Candidatus Kentron sp. LFY]
MDRILAKGMTTTARSPPFGMAGGESGKTGRSYVERAGGDQEELASTQEVAMEAGDVLVIETPRGGGEPDEG